MRSTTPSFVSTLRGRRRKLGDMTRDDDDEFKLQGFRFCPWLERWRLATTVMRVPCGVTFSQLSRHGREGPRLHALTTLTTPSDEVITDRKATFDVLAKAAVVCEGWMTRISDADIAGHMETVEELGEAVSALLGCNTRVAFDSAVVAVLRLLQEVENNGDLARFVRNYKTAAEGTHFLDAFYAPLLLRLHIVNVFMSSASHPPFDLSRSFPVLNVWLQKILDWSLFAQVMGSDFATELVVYYKDRGSFVFNSTPGVASGIGGPDVLSQHAKYVPALFLREQRFAVCATLVAKQSDWRSVLRLVEVDAKMLQKHANVEIRLESFRRHCSDQSAKFGLVFETIHEGVRRIRTHLLESMTLTQLWQMEVETWVELSQEEEALTTLVVGMLQSQPLESVVTFVNALLEMVLIGHDERVLKDILQTVYRECNPSDWVAIANRVPPVITLVITKDNWLMHCKFPAVSLLCSLFTIIKRHVLQLHDLLCPANGSMDAVVADEDTIRQRLVRLRQLVDFLHISVLRDHYSSVLSAFEMAKWSALHADVLQSDFAAFESQLFVALAPGPKRARLAWKKLKRDLVVHLRNQKKFVIPKMLRFVKGDALIEAQIACLENADLDMLVPEIEAHSEAAECEGVFNVLRSSPKHDALYRTCLALISPKKRDVLLLGSDSAGGGDDFVSGSLDWHPKFAGVPFILGLANRVMLEDLAAVVSALQRSLKGLGELPTTDARNTFEVFYGHFVSHKSIVFEPVVESLSAQSSIAEHAALEPQIEQLEELICKVEKAPGLERRNLLQETLVVAKKLQEIAVRFFDGFSTAFVPVCVAAFSFEQSMDLFGRIVRTYHSANPHLLCRTIASLKRDREYQFFCRNILSVSFSLLKDVLDTVRAEVPTRVWLRVTDTMSCLAGVTLDAPFWPELPLAGGVTLFWKLSHRHLESEMAALLAGINDRVQTVQSFNNMLNSSQQLMMYLEKHGQFEDDFLLPRIACAVPTIAESSYEDTANEHALLESNELRVISILKASFKSIEQQSNVVPLRQLNRMKRQLRSYQTLILPHLCKEEEKYYPLMLFRFSAMQCQTLFHHLFALYGKLMNDSLLLSLLHLATPTEQKRFLLEFLPSYLKYRNSGRPDTDMIFPRSDFFFIERVTLEQVAVLCDRIRPKLWKSLQKQFPNLTKD